VKDGRQRAGRVALLMAAFACLLAMFAPMLGTSRAQAQEASAAAEKPFHAPLAQVPEKARLRHNPLESDTDAVAAGGKLFEQHCAECHGKKAAGTKRGPSLLGADVRQATPGALFWVLTNGVVRHGMPVWSKLPEPMRWQLVTFLKSAQAPAGGGPGKGPVPVLNEKESGAQQR
jgi:mono/diheme cytochrome c family protein